MSYTLSDARNLAQDKLVQSVIDEFRKSPLLENMVFDDVATPQGQSFYYTYNRVTTLPTAAGRAINAEFVPQEAKTTQVTTQLKIFGGSFQIDRALAKYEHQLVDLVDFQTKQKVQAAQALAADWFINGDSATDATAFDGLDKALTGSSTERTADASLDLSTAALVKANWSALLYELRQVRKLMDGAPTLIQMNADMFAVMQSIADNSTQFQTTKNDVGAEILKWGSAILMNMGDKPGTSNPIIETDETSGKTDIYFTRIGLDGVHMITPTGQTGPDIYLPNMTLPGAVKEGEVEMIASMAVKASRSAAVLRGVKIG